MKYLRIQNKGELDVRLISLMGGSTKNGDTTKIGKFGTGLKYSLAWLVRNRIEFQVYVGSRQVEITFKEEEIQGTKFEVIYIDGERSSITSNMGVDWEGWMVCREIWCNAIDAGQNTFNLCAMMSTPDENTTTFFIENVGQIKETVDKWDHYFISEAPIYKCDSFTLYPPRDVMCIYKNGVLIKREKNLKSVFAYDIKHANINELREYKGYMPSDIFGVVRELPKEMIVDFLASLKYEHYEHGMDVEWQSGFTKNWEDALGERKIIGAEDLEKLQEKGMELEECTIVPQGIYDKLTDTFPQLSAIRTIPKRNNKARSSFCEVGDDELEEKLKVVMAMLKDGKYVTASELAYKTGVFTSDARSALDVENKQVMLSLDLKDKPLLELMSVVVRENEFYKHELGSHDALEHFVKLYANQLIK